MSNTPMTLTIQEIVMLDGLADPVLRARYKIRKIARPGPYETGCGGSCCATCASKAGAAK